MQAPPRHKFVQTEDGSFTLHSERFNESCHSTSGAREETHVHYLQGCRVAELMASQSKVRILEVGFGTGLGWNETFKFKQAYPNCELEFVSLELDEDLIRWSLPTAERKQAGELVSFELSQEKAKLTVIAGDARVVLPQWKLEAFDAIYQDAFSPRRNPTLWTVEWFQLLGSLSKTGTYLSTYSSSISIRKALVVAGFGIYPGVQFARKKSSTRARWAMPSDATLLEELAKHPTEALKDTPIL